MFFRKKRNNDVEGYDRISRLIEDRQSEQADEAEADDDEILLGRGPRPEARDRDPASSPRTRPSDLGGEVAGGDVEESVTLVRPPARTVPPAPEPATALEPPPSSVTPTVVTARPSLGDVAPAPPAEPAVSPAPPPLPEFAPPPAPAATFQPPRMTVPDIGALASQAGAQSLVAKDAVWEGKLVCSGNVRIEGTLRGEIETSGALFVAADARVEGTVRAKAVTLAGEVKGNLHCEERLEVLPGGAARGEVETGALVVHEGAHIDSRFQMQRAGA